MKIATEINFKTYQKISWLGRKVRCSDFFGLKIFDAAEEPVSKIHFHSLHRESHLAFPCCFAVAVAWHTWWYFGTNWAKVALIEVYWNWSPSTMKATTYWTKHRREGERLETRWSQDVLSDTVVNPSSVAKTWNYRTRIEIAWDCQVNQYSDKINIWKCTRLVIIFIE